MRLQGKERTVAMIKNKITLPTDSYWKPNNFITAPLMRAMNESAPVKTAPQMRRVNIFSLLFTQKVFKSSDTFPLQIFRKNLWRQRKPTISFIPKVSAPVRLWRQRTDRCSQSAARQERRGSQKSCVGWFDLSLRRHNRAGCQKEGKRCPSSAFS